MALCIILVIVFIIRTWVPKHQELLFSTSWTTYAGAILVGICGFGLGYILAFVSKLPSKDVRTVALETGIQNGPLSFGIIIATFQDQVQDKILLLPLLYGILIIISSSFATLLFRRLSSGYYLVDDFVLPDAGWWESYYVPLLEVLDRFRIKHSGNAGALAVASKLQHEIDIYRNYSKHYGYAFFVLKL